ncbi:MAG: A/G-specific adenine glycosylase [Nitrospinae bacterium]|nr:A/G-specific adenine glycosylase [Nitrospinota bacterium]
MATISAQRIAAFRKTVYGHFAKNGRSLPWRKKVTPYSTFVSEVMLQQTQVPRVAEIFPRFMKKFTNWEKLANAPLKEVLAAWQGMGYNRRARFLHQAANEVVDRFGGKLPADPELLKTLPGIGPATAASIAAFGFNRPTVFVETNIRAVFIHHFFRDKEQVPDEEVLKLVERTLDRKDPRRWYSALMDYGTHLKKAHKNPARRSLHHKKQGRFEGSARQARGRVMAELVRSHKPLAMREIASRTGLAPQRAKDAVTALAAEGLLRKTSGGYAV